MPTTSIVLEDGGGVILITEVPTADLPASSDALHIIGVSVGTPEDLGVILRVFDAIATHQDTYVLGRGGLLCSESALRSAFAEVKTKPLRASVDVSSSEDRSPVAPLDVWLPYGIQIETNTGTADLGVADRPLIWRAVCDTILHTSSARSMLSDFHRLWQKRPQPSTRCRRRTVGGVFLYPPQYAIDLVKNDVRTPPALVALLAECGTELCSDDPITVDRRRRRQAIAGRIRDTLWPRTDTKKSADAFQPKAKRTRVE